jgi:hypothetical protein
VTVSSSAAPRVSGNCCTFSKGGRSILEEDISMAGRRCMLSSGVSFGLLHRSNATVRLLP